jgi:hypothetical protein
MTKAGTVVIPITAYINAEDAKVQIIVKIGTDINLERIPGETRPKILAAFNITS